MKPEAIAGTAAIAAAAAIGLYVASGHVPDARGDVCSVSTAYGPCEAAKALGADPDDCKPGTMIYRRVEQRFDPDADGGSGSLPAGFSGVVGSTHEVSCASLRRPDKALTARKPNDASCVVGEWQRSDGGLGVGRCCEPGCSCRGRCVATVPSVLAGYDPTTEELCAAMPERCPPRLP